MTLDKKSGTVAVVSAVALGRRNVNKTLQLLDGISNLFADNNNWASFIHRDLEEISQETFHY